jgi:pullulanase/glycogen debranching enzyme
VPFRFAHEQGHGEQDAALGVLGLGRGVTVEERIAQEQQFAHLAAGERYGLRASGPYDPRNGHRFNPRKLLVDPYAKALDGPLVLHPALFGELADGTTRSDVDSAPFIAKAVAAPPLPPAPVATARVRTPWSP